jgi:anti-sigma regulatory factor (Ser/Thr protein kinase)
VTGLQRVTDPLRARKSDLLSLSISAGEVEDKNVEQWRTLAEFSLASEPGNERSASEQVTWAVKELKLGSHRLERLKTAVAEATMNAMEHGNKYRPDLPVFVRVLVSESASALSVQITDRGEDQPIPDPETPDLDAKLAGQQTPRGWGLFLIEKMVDEMHVTSGKEHHTIELILHLKGAEHAGRTA